MSQSVFDSWDSFCKDPFGALPTGQAVRFTLCLPKHLDCTEPVLKLFEMDHWDTPRLLPMQLRDADLRDNFFTCTFEPEQPGTFVYHFELPTPREVLEVRKGGDGRGYISHEGDLWQLTVYDGQMQAPSFLREGVIYQIFPDRFHKSGETGLPIPAGRTFHESWEELPDWRPNEQGEITNTDFFGGNLRGIMEKLDYLQDLGVTVLYLNPIFEAHSNHRYDTADYCKIDPLLGSEEDLRELCRRAGERGIRILLDGVFSHTGSDSLYFNREGRYGKQGAYQDPDSPYRSWYIFYQYPDSYDCWWGFYTLPNVNERDPAYQEFICGENGVLRKWLRTGVAGFRLDVADELPDEFLDLLHRSIKDFDPDAAIIGEVWEDASNKVSYGVRRRYLLGKQLDSVMNYPFMEAILAFIRYGDCGRLYNTVLQILENYPKPAVQSLMNSLSTHDTIRAITALGGKPLEYHDREWQCVHHRLSEGEYEHGCRLFALATILQFGLPGMPCVYYGDEAGMCGYKDPFSRAPYPWGNENLELHELVKRLGAMRRDYPVFGDADYVPLSFRPEVCSFLRRDTAGRRYFLFAVNRSDKRQPLELQEHFTRIRALVTVGSYRADELGPYSGVVLLMEE